MHIAHSIYHKLLPIIKKKNFKFLKVGNIKLILHSLDNHQDEKRDLKQRRENVAESIAVPIKKSGTLKQKMGVSSYARQLIPYHVNESLFIYRVNFEAGKG